MDFGRQDTTNPQTSENSVNIKQNNTFNPPPGRTIESKQRKNKSLALLDLMTMDDPNCSSYPTYWTQYKVTHGKLGLALGIGQARPPTQVLRHNILTGEEVPTNEKENHHLISRSQILLQERQSEQEKLALYNPDDLAASGTRRSILGWHWVPKTTQEGSGKGVGGVWGFGLRASIPTKRNKKGNLTQ